MDCASQKDDDPEKQLKVNGVYRIPHALEQKPGAPPDRAALQLLVTDLTRPNGIAFSPDEKYLYVNNSEPKKIWMRYRVKPDGSLTDAKLLYDATADTRPGAPDGMKVDEEGNIYSAGPGGVWIFSPEGKPLATILFRGESRQSQLGGTGSKNALYRRQQQHLSRASENPGRSRHSSRIRSKVTGTGPRAICLNSVSAEFSRTVRSQQLSGSQVANQSTIRSQKVILRQIFKPHPAELLKDPVFQLSCELVHGEKLQVDCAAMTIVVADVGDARADAGLDPEFLVQFAGQGLLRALSRLDLAPRKLPLQPHRLIGTPLADQHLTAANDQTPPPQNAGPDRQAGNWSSIVRLPPLQCNRPERGANRAVNSRLNL